MIPKRKRTFVVTAILLGVLYVLAMAGLMSDMSGDVQKFIPFLFLVTAACMFWFHYQWSKTFLLFIAFVVVSAFIVSYAAATTGAVFGGFTYGKGLGSHWFGVPPMIGILWLILIYSMGSTIGRWVKTSIVLQSLVAASLLTLLDYYIEHIAIKLSFWEWPGDIVPVQNYIGFFLVSFLFFLIFYALRLQDRNPMAPFVLLLQCLFFVGLNLLI